MTTNQIHTFLKHHLALIFEQLSVEGGMDIVYSNKNLDRIAHDIEDYMVFCELPDVSVGDEFKVDEVMDQVS
jgi:hypothetical protein